MMILDEAAGGGEADDDVWAELAAAAEREAYLEALLAAQVRDAAHWREVAREATERLCAVREAVMYGGMT